IDLFHADMGQNTAIKERSASQPATGAIRYLQSRTPARFAGISHPQEIVALPANLAMRYGLYDARRYDYPVQRRSHRMCRREAAGPGGSGRIGVKRRERVVVRAGADRLGLLVLPDSYFAGWKAKVDGRDAPVERVDYMFRGVRLTPGAHEVEFRYEPASFRIG